MNEDFVRRITSWVESGVKKVTPTVTQSEHVDRILGRMDPDDMIENGLWAYREAVAVLGSRSTEIMAAFVIPLSDAQEVEPMAPASDAILADRSNEPPSLALIDRDALRIVHRVEEYVAPCVIPKLKVGGDSYCFYRVFRDYESMRNHYEFGRCICIYHVGESSGLSGVQHS